MSHFESAAEMKGLPALLIETWLCTIMVPGLVTWITPCPSKPIDQILSTLTLMKWWWTKTRIAILRAAQEMVMSMHLFYTCGSAFSHILTLMHFGDLHHHSDSFNTFTSSNSEMSCTHVHHLRMFYHVSMHHTSAHLQIFNIIHTCVTCCQNLRTSADTHPFIFHHIPGTLYRISKHLPAWKHMYTKYPVLSMHGTQNIRNTFGNIWTPIHLILQHS